MQQLQAEQNLTPDQLLQVQQQLMLSNLTPEQVQALQLQQQQLMMQADQENANMANVLRQKQDIDRTLKSYFRQAKRMRRNGTRSAPRKKHRRTNLQRVQKRNFEREFNNQQLKRLLRRDAKQLSIQEKIYRLASYLETNKLLDEKKKLRELKRRRRGAGKRVNASTEDKYKSQMNNVRNAI